MDVLDFILSFLSFIAVFAAIIFLYARLTRLLKKKSHHYIVHPTPEKDKNWHPVHFSKYECFIFVKDNTEEFTTGALYTSLNEKNEASIFKANDIALNQQNNWTLLKIDPCSFVAFKSFVAQLDAYYEQGHVTGFCRHKSIALQDYLFKIDKSILDKNFIGAFRNGKNFGIYLANADLHETGNISLSRNHEVNFHSEIADLPLELMEGEMSPYETLINDAYN